jgi:spermidine synthase
MARAVEQEQAVIAPRFRLLALLFFFSGASGLIYEVVWLRMLIRTFGVTIYAVSTVLGVFMAGLAIGSIAAGRWLEGRTRLVRYYALAEVAIGLSAGASTLLMSVLPRIFHHLAHDLPPGGASVTAIRFVLATVVLFPTTFFMGTTLPVLSGWLSGEDASVAKKVGVLYSVNTLGAVIGTIATGFVLLASAGERATLLLAAAINVGVGIGAYAVSRSTPDSQRAHSSATSASPEIRSVLIIALFSGFCALFYQVVWSRILNLILGNSVYGFSLMLAVYLAGIAIGSAIVSRFVDRLKHPLAVFGALELGIALLTIGSLHLFRAIGAAYANPDYTYSQIWTLSDFWRLGLHAIAIVLPPTLLFGAIFPVAGRLVLPPGARTEESVGRLYGYNTIGAIGGSLASGFLFVPLFGTLISFLVASIISFAIALYLFAASKKREGFARANLLAWSSAPVFVLLLSVSFQDPFLEVLMARIPGNEELLEHIEDKAATVTLTKTGSERTLYINGLYVSNSGAIAGKVMIHPVLAYNPEPKSVLLVGLGVGDAFRAALDAHLDVTVAELLPAVRGLFARYAPGGEGYLGDPNAHIIIADGRNFLLASERRFDYVFVDGTPPVFASGMVNLYSFELVQLVREHLTQGGIFAIWFPPVCFEADFWMIVRNFADTFDNIALFAPRQLGGLVILGTPSKEPIFDVDAATMAQRLGAHGFEAPEQSVQAIRSAMIGPQSRLRTKAARYPRLTDDHPYTEFPLFSFVRGLPYFRDGSFAMSQN